MDHFNVPKKVNRHVLKALSILSGGDRSQVIVTSNIINQVKHQMRNLVPVSNIESAVQKSLKNLSEIGLIERRGMYRYTLGRCAAIVSSPGPQPNARNPDRRVFHGNDPRRCSRSNLDPNMKRGYGCSEESLSGDDFDRTRKRMRTNNKQVRHCGRWAYLPRVRQHHQPNHPIDTAIDTPLISQDLYFLHHPRTQLQECYLSRSYRDSLEFGNSAIMSNGALDFMLATVTPTPSLEISEITDDVKKIVDVRRIVETPPLEQQIERECLKMEHEIEEFEEKEEGVQTENIPLSPVSDYKSETSYWETAPAQMMQSASKTINPNQISKSGISRRLMNTTNAAISQKSSKSLLPDYTQSYIK